MFKLLFVIFMVKVTAQHFLYCARRLRTFTVRKTPMFFWTAMEIVALRKC